MKSEIKTALIFGIIIATGLGVVSMIFLSFDEKFESANIISEGSSITKIDKSGFKTAPDLVGIAHYLNTTPEKLGEQMQDKVILYDIWTYSCINCIRTLPYITAWDDKYANQGLLIIGVHSPEFEFEKDPDNVKMAIEKLEDDDIKLSSTWI